MTSSRKLDDLRRRRARDAISVIEQQDPIETTAVPDVKLRACSARELEWISPELALQGRDPIRGVNASHSKVGVVSPFTPSLLVVTYTARYFLSPGAHGSPGSGPTREVYTVYGDLQATLLPTERHFKL